MRRSPTLLVSACDFGWGSVGKLRLILEELEGFTIGIQPRSRTWELASSLIGAGQQFVDCDAVNATAGLVINDPAAANELMRQGLPVIYVDSLPYLWATDAEVPRRTTVYCAQRTLGELPSDGPLAGRTDIRWIEAIVPRRSTRRGGAGIVVNVGGLHSHLVGSASDAYLRLVVLPLVEMLIASDLPLAAVCGNIPQWACEMLAGVVPRETPVGAQNSAAFERTLDRADMLVTSPGSTTMLQAAMAGLPTMLLPGQNLSQLLNTDIFTTSKSGVALWPQSVISRDEVDRLRPAGEDAVLAYIYGAIESAAESAADRAAVANAIGAALLSMPAEGALSGGVRRLGTQGARQVAQIVRQALLAPFPRAGTPAPT